MEPVRGVTPPTLPRMDECTFFFGVNYSWGINTAENKYLRIKKMIKLHNQEYPTWRLTSKTPPLLYIM
jgi:hypothetical protein